MVARRCMTLTKVSLVFLKPSASRSLESVRWRPSRSPCWVRPVCRSVSIARCFSSSSGATAATGSLSELRKRAKPSASQTRTARLAAATMSAISAMRHFNAGALAGCSKGGMTRIVILSEAKNLLFLQLKRLRRQILRRCAPQNDNLSRFPQRRHRRAAERGVRARPGVEHNAGEPERGPGEPDPAVPDEVELEHARRERPADRGRAERAEEACDRAEHGELGALRGEHLGAARPERAHD